MKYQASEGNFLVLKREAISSKTEKVIGSWQDSVTLHWPGEQGSEVVIGVVERRRRRKREGGREGREGGREGGGGGEGGREGGREGEREGGREGGGEGGREGRGREGGRRRKGGGGREKINSVHS